MDETPMGLLRGPDVEYADLLGRPTGRAGVEDDLDDYEFNQSLYEV